MQKSNLSSTYNLEHFRLFSVGQAGRRYILWLAFVDHNSVFERQKSVSPRTRFFPGEARKDSGIVDARIFKMN